MPGSFLGNAVRRVEDPTILRGAAKYVDDLPLEGALHAVFVRSTVAHARIEGVDTKEAAGMPGVVAVYTASDLDLPAQQSMPMVPATFNRPPLADGVVRFVGEAVAVIIAESRAAGVDAAEAVVVDYDPLPSVIDAEAALADGAPILFGEAGTNVAVDLNFGTDPSIFDGADVIARGRFINQRLAAVPLEGNAFAAVPEGDALTAYAATQMPHALRDGLAGAFGLEPEAVRVIAPAVGGGFGAKVGAYSEFIVAMAAARRLGRPVKWVETRSENLVSMSHGRAQVQDVEIGATRDGTLVGLRAAIVGDGGAYPGMGAFLPFLTRMMAQGVYRIPKVEVNARSATTNTTPTSAYRGAGRPEATAMLERAMDLLAGELGIDPVELRRKNLIRRDEFPYSTVTGAEYDIGDYEASLDKAVEVAGYAELRKEQQRRRDRGDTKQLGIGVSTYVEVTAPVGMTIDFASVEVGDDGRVTVLSGTSAHGQGHQTAYAQIVAELLGVPMDQITVVQSDTSVVPRGTGTAGSRSLQIGGGAVYRASESVLDKAKRIAAHLLEADHADITLHEGGTVGVAGSPANALTWAELAVAAKDPARLPEGEVPGLSAALDFDQGASSFPFGCHIAVAEVDTETGEARLIRHIAVDDCGRILNPMLVDGQVHGGIAQGVAQALFEAYVYDDDGNPLTGTLVDYAFPAASELPSFETAHTETPTPLNPLGAKGIGESGTIGSTPAVQNAVVDAVSHLGVRHIDMPLTPERVWRAIQDAAGG
jgi:carbon-monoxide dehydrogenase large subunit